MIRAAALLALLATPAPAQEAWITPATIPALPGGEDAHLLRVLAHAQVAQANCPGPVVTAGPWLLLRAAEDSLVERMRLDASAVEAVHAAVVAALAKPGFCAREVPRLAPVLDMLVFWGGSPRLIRD